MEDVGLSWTHRPGGKQRTWTTTYRGVTVELVKIGKGRCRIGTQEYDSFEDASDDVYDKFRQAEAKLTARGKGAGK